VQAETLQLPAIIVRGFFLLHAIAHWVHISGAMHQALCRVGGFVMEQRGRLTIKVFIVESKLTFVCVLVYSVTNSQHSKK